MTENLEVVLASVVGGMRVVRRLDPVRCVVTGERLRLAGRVETADGVRYELVGNDGMTPKGTRTWEQLRGY